MRPLTAAFIAALESGEKLPILFYEGEFTSGTLRLWSGVGEIAWNGQTWLGAGLLEAGVSEIEETGDIKANGISVFINGIPASTLSLVLSEIGQGKPGNIWWGFLDDGGNVVADPDTVFMGYLDVPDIQESGDSARITISYENALIDLERPREFRYTSESQKIFYLDDQGFDYVPSLQEWSGNWGVG